MIVNFLPFFGLLAVICTGCTLLPVDSEQSSPLPTSWSVVPPHSLTSTDTQWWQAFGSAELDNLLDEALLKNRNLDSMRRLLEQTYVQWHMNRVPWSPDIGASTSTGHSGTWGAQNQGNNYGASVSLSYRPDIWGSQAAIANGSEALWRAAGYNVEATALLLRSAVVTQYLQLLSIREQTDLAQLNLSISRGVLSLIKSRYKAGAVAELDFTQQLALVASLEASLPQLQQQEQQSLTSLASLLDLPPQELNVQMQGLTKLTIPEINGGLPSTLMFKRPDLLSAQQQLAATGFDIDAARTSMFPSISISAASGVASIKLQQLFRTDPTWTVGLALDLPIWDQGRRVDQQRLALLNRKIAFNNYRQNLLTAFGEVENALHAGANLQRQQHWQDMQLQAASESLRISGSRYRAGAVDLQNLLAAQAVLYGARQASSILRYQRLQAACNLAVALGG